jgi:hypothetical protein
LVAGIREVKKGLIMSHRKHKEKRIVRVASDVEEGMLEAGCCVWPTEEKV